MSTSKLAAVPTVSLAMSAAQSFADGIGATALPLDVENEDAFGMHDNATPSRFTAPVAGLYLVTVRVTWFANNTGLRLLSVRDPNNVIDRVIHVVETARDGSATFLSGTGVERLAAGETREIVVSQTSGGNLDVQDALTEARVTWIGN